MYKHLCGQPCVLDDLQEEDPTLHRSAKASHTYSTDTHAIHNYTQPNSTFLCVTDTHSHIREWNGSRVSCFPYSGLVQVSQCSSASEVSSLHLTFISQTSRFGSVQTAELEPGGATKEVTLDNRDEYLCKVVEYYMYGE